MREVELKAVVPDEGAARARLAAASARLLFEGTSHDRRYDYPTRALASRDTVLRLRVEHGPARARAILECKGAASVQLGYKVREEIGSEVADAAAVHAILTSAGLDVIRETERDVSIFDVGGAAVRFERYPRMDVLVEVEGTPEQIEGAIRVLGIPRSAFTAEALASFVQRYERRTGVRAAICRRELAGDFRYRVDDA